YHVNSNHPNSAFLIATTLQFATTRTGIAVRAIRWPRPHELKFQFSPQPLSVFSGTFPVRILLRAAPGARSQVLKGTLRYQACNDNLCRPPASLPVAIRLTVR
ncbi:MAG: protein-disulfide reductase DsbD domain-containing protein, partial [Terriglobales bacterium]